MRVRGCRGLCVHRHVAYSEYETMSTIIVMSCGETFHNLGTSSGERILWSDIHNSCGVFQGHQYNTYTIQEWARSRVSGCTFVMLCTVGHMHYVGYIHLQHSPIFIVSTMPIFIVSTTERITLLCGDTRIKHCINDWAAARLRPFYSLTRFAPHISTIWRGNNNGTEIARQWMSTEVRVHYISWHFNYSKKSVTIHWLSFF